MVETSNPAPSNTPPILNRPISSTSAQPEKKPPHVPRKMIRIARQMDIFIFLAYSFPVMLFVGWVLVSSIFGEIYKYAVYALMVVSTILYIIAIFLCIKNKIRIPVAVYLSLAIHAFGCATLLGWLPLYTNAGQAMGTMAAFAVASILVPIFLRSNVV